MPPATFLAESSRAAIRRIRPEDREEFVVRVRDSVDLHHPWLAMPDTAEAFDSYLAPFDDNSASAPPGGTPDRMNVVDGKTREGLLIRRTSSRATRRRSTWSSATASAARGSNCWWWSRHRRTKVRSGDRMTAVGWAIAKPIRQTGLLRRQAKDASTIGTGSASETGPLGVERTRRPCETSTFAGGGR
jgi:hypothetical protein